MTAGSSAALDGLFRPESAAVIAVDIQNDFCHPEGAQARAGRSILHVSRAVQNAAHLISAARHHGVLVTFVQTIHSESTDSPAWGRRHRPHEASRNCLEGTWGAGFFKVKPTPGDTVVSKHRYSAFINTNLEDVLRAGGRSSLFFVGVATRVCVESSLRDAVCLDFDATLVSDCCGDYSEVSHENAVASVRGGFGGVMEQNEVATRWSAWLNGRQFSGVDK